MEDERVVQQDDCVRLAASGGGGMGRRRETQCASGRVTLSQTVVQGRYWKCSKEGPGRRGGMITGGQKQTSVWDANNTREQAGGRTRRRAMGGWW